MPEFFPRVNVREMNFDGWNLNGGNGVAKRDARVGVGCSVQDDPIKRAFGLLNPAHQLAFNIGLAKFNGCPGLLRSGSNSVLDLR